MLNIFMEIYSFSPEGYRGNLVEIEISILGRSLPGIEIVGLPGTAIKEAKVRVRSAILKSNYDFPKGRIILNMAPAGKKKEGAMFDLAFALSIILFDRDFKKYIVIGELTLDGRVRGVNGVLPAIIKGKECGIENFIIPRDNFKEASILKYGKLYPVESLKEAVDSILEKVEFSKYEYIKDNPIKYENFKDVLEQESAIKAVEIAVAGGHNLFLFGPPGVGKSMILNRIRSVLPNLSSLKAIETSMIWSISGKKVDSPYIEIPPIRKPHHGATLESIIGGGKSCNPGEISLAHNGVLLLDELPEFKSSIIQSLREPIEDGSITLTRANTVVWYPSNFQLIATANPCPCGNLGKENGVCFCSDKDIRVYWKKIGGAIFDRIDIRVPMTPFSFINNKFHSPISSEEMSERIERAITIQYKRYRDESFDKNSEIDPGNILKYCNIEENLMDEFRHIVKKLALSNRGFTSILKVARTIADLRNSKYIEREDLLESINYRRYGDDDYYFN